SSDSWMTRCSSHSPYGASCEWRGTTSSRSCGQVRSAVCEPCSRSPSDKVSLGGCGLGNPLRHRRGRREHFAQLAKHVGALSLERRLQAAEVEPAELDPPLRVQRAEAEVREEIPRKDRAVDLEALIRRLALAVAVGERLERGRVALTCLADRREKQRLHDPRRRRLHEIRARDEKRVVARRTGRQLLRARKELRRAELHRAEEAAVVVVVHGSPCAGVVLDLLDPAPLVGGPAAARLPPDTPVADARRSFQRRASEACDPRGHPCLSSTSSVASGRAAKRNGTNVVPSPAETCMTPPGRR